MMRGERISALGPQAANRAVRVEIPALGFKMDGTTGPDGRWHGVSGAPATLARWSPDHPTLYDVRFVAGEDVLRVLRAGIQPKR